MRQQTIVPEVDYAQAYIHLFAPLRKYLEPFRPCFSHRQWKYFVTVLLGLIEHKGRHTLKGLLASVWDKVSHGILLHQPAYTRYYVHLGEISSYPPGYKENGSVFCHTNPWVMIAETVLGHGDRAYDYYQRINPSALEAISEVHRCEPYVYAQMIAGRDAPTFGEAKNAWLTGAAAWNYVAVTQHILGIHPTFQGLRIAPVIPAGWAGFTARRVFRGVTYHITVRRVGPGNRVSLRVDGRPVQGDIVSPPPGTEVVQVDVEIGG